MTFTKPVTSLTYSDIEGLTSSGEAESVVLDYKATIAGLNRDKAELAKDVSAFANSQGGFIIIGVEESRAKPVHPPAGVDRMLGQQKVEEWIDQVVASNISPRVPITMQVIDHADDPNRCLVVVYAAVSPRAPHMVTTEGDNRYYRRYFKRQQYQSLPAEEYEVRELFHRSSRMRDEVEALMASRGFANLSYAEYGLNEFSRRLTLTRREKDGNYQLSRGESLILFTSCPEVITPRQVPVSNEEFWAWMDSNVRKYPPVGGFVPYETARPVSHGALFFTRYGARDSEPEAWAQYLYVHDTGYVEMGIGGVVVYDGVTAFPLTSIIARYWQFVRFTKDLYKRYSILWPAQVDVHLRQTTNAVLHQLGKGWREPFDAVGMDYRPRCMDHHLVIGVTFPNPDTPEEMIEEYVRQVATDIDYAFGHRGSRAFGNPKSDPEQSLQVGLVDRSHW